MIKLTRFNGSNLFVNEELVEMVEHTPDTVLTFVSGRKLLVKEDIVGIITKIREYKDAIFQGE
ncbi:MAG: flagellar FlbD family protein [Candidatus Wallbacteria bacterium]|nr:flagellar FlbD family protein [Candidatus Wallbacteria bacterium]